MDPKGGGFRMWIGNLDPYLTEYSLLRLFQNFQINIKNFNIVYHRHGPEKGKSKGYCFLTVSTEEDAQKLIKGLDCKVVMGSKLHVRFAYGEGDFKEKKSDTKKSKTSQNNLAAIRNFQIKQIEAKLKAMEAGDT